MKKLILVFLLFVLPLAARARESKLWRYQEMLDKADLVVIAKPDETKETTEKSILDGIGPPTHVVGIETSLEVAAVLKGEKDLKKFVLHHYRLVKPNKQQKIMIDPPDLCDFVHDGYHDFLLFLIREPDGRYAPVSGQADPASDSVLPLPGGPRPATDSGAS